MEVDREIVALGEKRVLVCSQLAAGLDPLFLGGGMQQRQVKAEGRGALCLQEKALISRAGQGTFFPGTK